MIYVSEIFLAGISVLMAWWHARLIKANRPIVHWAWAGLFCLIVASDTYLIYDELGTWWLVFVFFLANLLLRTVVFNLFLNHFRGLSLFYFSTETTSKDDQAENWLFATPICVKVFGARKWPLYIILTVMFLALQPLFHS